MEMNSANEEEKMKSVKLKVAVIVGVIVVILMGILLISKQAGPGNNTIAGRTNESTVVGEFVEKQADGSRVNTSEQLKKTKTVEGLEWTNIQLVEKNGISEIKADVKNITDDEIKELAMLITVVDKEGNMINELDAIVFDVGPGQTIKINPGITADISNAYDFTIRKK